MSMTLRTREVNGTMIIDLSGRLTMGEPCAAVREEVLDEIGHGSRKILLNLADVSYIDSSGLGQLIGSNATVVNAGGRMKLLNLQNRVQDLLQVTKLLTVFDTYTSETAALRSFAAAATQ